MPLPVRWIGRPVASLLLLGSCSRLLLWVLAVACAGCCIRRPLVFVAVRHRISGFATFSDRIRGCLLRSVIGFRDFFTFIAFRDFLKFSHRIQGFFYVHRILGFFKVQSSHSGIF